MRVYALDRDQRARWIKPGQVVQLLSPALEPIGNPCLVVVVRNHMPGMVKALKSMATDELYSKIELHGLADLVTGEVTPAPLLSNRLVQVKDAMLVVSPVDEDEVTVLSLNLEVHLHEQSESGGQSDH